VESSRFSNRSPNIEIAHRSAVEIGALINSGLLSAEDVADRTLTAIGLVTTTLFLRVSRQVVR